MENFLKFVTQASKESEAQGFINWDILNKAAELYTKRYISDNSTLILEKFTLENENKRLKEEKAKLKKHLEDWVLDSDCLVFNDEYKKGHKAGIKNALKFLTSPQ